MKVALITSNNLSIGKSTKKGTEILFRILISKLHRSSKTKNLQITAFASGDSNLPIKIETVDFHSTSFDTTIPHEKKIMFELALLSKAFSLQDHFDLYNVHIGDGDLVLPFARFVSRPIIITIHHVFDKPYVKRFFSLFQHLPNVYFISLSNYQRTFFPQLNFIKTIYNGIEEKEFKFDQFGGEMMMWSGRGDPAKGLDTAFQVVNQTKKKTKFFIIRKDEQQLWLEKTLKLISSLKIEEQISIAFDSIRDQLITQYQTSKLFLFPTTLEESCPLSALEAMACGTPVIAYAHGAIPEIIKDGETGFIINSSENNIRGDWVVKKTGIDGLSEAVEKIYSMSKETSLKMRQACRKHIEQSFTAERMANDYIKVYEQILTS